jgi:hypothetical protein
MVILLIILHGIIHTTVGDTALICMDTIMGTMKDIITETITETIMEIITDPMTGTTITSVLYTTDHVKRLKTTGLQPQVVPIRSTAKGLVPLPEPG